MSRITIVDTENNVIGAKERDSLKPGDIYRVSVLWLTNSRGHILMAQRVQTKKIDPGVWGPAVAGTVEEGESYEQNILKEVSEELGLALSCDELRVGPIFHIHGRRNDYFSQWYLYTIDKPAEDFDFEREEVEQVRWFEPSELKQMMREHPEQFTFAAPQWSKTMLP